MAETLEELQAREAALLKAIADRPALGVVRSYVGPDGSSFQFRSLAEIREELANIRQKAADLAGETVISRRTFATPNRSL